MTTKEIAKQIQSIIVKAMEDEDTTSKNCLGALSSQLSIAVFATYQAGRVECTNARECIQRIELAMVAAAVIECEMIGREDSGLSETIPSPN